MELSYPKVHNKVLNHPVEVKKIGNYGSSLRQNTLFLDEVLYFLVKSPLSRLFLQFQTISFKKDEKYLFHGKSYFRSLDNDIL